MSAVVAVARPVAPTRALAPALATVEARRLLRHPVMLVGFGLWLFAVGESLFSGLTVVQAFETITGALSFFPGVPAILAAHMVATRDRRAGSLDLLGTLPGRAHERVRALCLAALAPALVGLVLNTALTAYLLAIDAFGQTPSVWHVVQAPVTILGACLLGTMLGVWAPNLFTPVLTLVALVVVNLMVSERDPLRLFGPAMFWADWGPFDGTIWVGLHPGSAFGHVLYLLGLCGMAAAAALVRVAEQRRTVVVFGLASVALTALGGWVQLP